MGGTHSFTIEEDGRTLTCLDSALFVFIDDTGHEGLRDPKLPIFGFGGCLTYAGDYQNTIVKPWKALEKTFPPDMLPLHAGALRRDRLTDENMEALNEFFRGNVFGRFAAVCTDKTINSVPEIETMRYMVAVTHLRIKAILETIFQHGLSVSEIIMFIEKSQRTRYKISEYFSEWKFQLNSHTIPLRRYFMTKASNEPGLVVADFIAHTAGSTVHSKLRGTVSDYLERRDCQSIFAPKDDRWVSFEEVNTVERTRPKKGTRTARRPKRAR